MVLATLRFRDYCLRYNPVKLEITNKYRNRQYTVAAKGTFIESLEQRPVVYSGVGELYGADCILQYRELEKLFFEGKKGVLCLPGMPATEVWFTGLEFLGDTQEDVLTYKFEFTQADTYRMSTDKKFHICRSGETLYDIAFEYGIKVEKLVELNPSVRRPDELKKGKKVRLC